MSISLSKPFVLILLLISMSSSALSQERVVNLADTFAPVDAALRPSLAQRIKLFVEYEQTRQWDKLYDLTYKPDINHESKDEFIRRQQFFAGSQGASRTLDFVPQTATSSYEGIEGHFEIEGCLKVRWKGRVHHWLAGMDACLVDGEWYLNGIFTITSIDAPPRPCNKTPASNNGMHPTPQ